MKNRVVSLLLVVIMATSLLGCGNTDDTSKDSSNNSNNKTSGEASVENESNEEEDGYQYADQDITLVVDLHGWMPSINEEATAENPSVFRSPQLIADAFTELYPNITIEWARNKPVGALQDETAEWFATQINAGTCPAIAFSWGVQYQDRDWYVPLDEYLDTPNEFMEGNAQWRDMFPEYLWSNGGIDNAKDEVVAIPIVLYTGPATGYFYNADAFAELNLEIPTTWEEMLDASTKLTEAGYIGMGACSLLPNISVGNWVSTFCVGPYIAGYIMDETDYDGDGTVSGAERARAVKEGLFNPEDHAYAQEYYKQLKRYYATILEPGWSQNASSGTYYTKFNEGELGILEDGLWNLGMQASNVERVRDYGAFCCPPLSTDTTEYTIEAQYTEKGPYQPKADLSLNIMKDAVADDPALLDAAVKFLKFLTLPDNIGSMVVEMGSGLGAVEGADVPVLMEEWMDQSFPIAPNCSFPNGFVSEKTSELDANFEIWVLDGMSDEDFWKKVNEIQQAGVDQYIINNNLDTTEWNIK